MKRLLFFSAVLALVWVPLVFAGTSTDPWDSAFENEPASTAPVSGGPNEFHAFKGEVRKRAEVGHDWDTAGFHDAADSGRHLLGSARIFDEESTPSVCANISAIIEPDATGSSVLDKGRLCVEKDDNDLWWYDGTTWVEITHDPTPPAGASSITTASDGGATGSVALTIPVTPHVEFTSTGLSGDLSATITCASDSGSYDINVWAEIKAPISTSGVDNPPDIRTMFAQLVKDGTPLTETASSYSSFVIDIANPGDPPTNGSTTGNLSLFYHETGLAPSTARTFTVEVWAGEAWAGPVFVGSPRNYISATCLKTG